MLYIPASEKPYSYQAVLYCHSTLNYVLTVHHPVWVCMFYQGTSPLNKASMEHVVTISVTKQMYEKANQ